MTFNIQASLAQPGKASTYLVLGDLYTILAGAEDTNGQYGLVETLMQPQSAVPSHIHDGDEGHYILEGEIEYQLDEKTIVATAGTFVNIPKGQWHAFKNIGSSPAKLLMLVTPAGGEQFFAEVGHPVNLPLNEEQRSLLGTVNPADIEKAIALAITKYGLEFKLPAAENS